MPKNEEPCPCRTATAAAAPATVHIQIDGRGEICAWGLAKELEALIMERTGNRELHQRLQDMSYELCG